MTAKFFPILGCDHRRPETSGFMVPWAFLAPHEAQVKANHHGQDLETLARRGGLGAHEALQAVKGERLVDGKLNWSEAKAELVDRIEAWKKIQPEQVPA